MREVSRPLRITAQPLSSFGVTPAVSMLSMLSFAVLLILAVGAGHVLRDSGAMFFLAVGAGHVLRDTFSWLSERVRF